MRKRWTPRMAEQKMYTLETKASKKYIGNIGIAELLIPYGWPAKQGDKTISAASLDSQCGCYLRQRFVRKNIKFEM